MTPLDIIQGARALMAERGLCRGQYVESTEGHKLCMLGAIRLAAGGRIVGEPGEYYMSFNPDEENVPVTDVIDVCEFALHDLYPGFYHLSTFNDSAYSDTEGALTVFDHAIKRLTKS